MNWILYACILTSNSCNPIIQEPQYTRAICLETIKSSKFPENVIVMCKEKRQ